MTLALAPAPSKLTALEGVFTNLIPLVADGNDDLNLKGYAEHILKEASKTRLGPENGYVVMAHKAVELFKQLPPFDVDKRPGVRRTSDPKHVMKDSHLQTRTYLWSVQLEGLSHSVHPLGDNPGLVDEILRGLLSIPYLTHEPAKAFDKFLYENYTKLRHEVFLRALHLATGKSNANVIKRSWQSLGGKYHDDGLRLAGSILQALESGSECFENFHYVHVPDMIKGPCRAFALKAAEIGCAADNLLHDMGVSLGMPDGSHRERSVPWCGWKIELSDDLKRVRYIVWYERYYQSLVSDREHARYSFIDKAKAAVEKRNAAKASPKFAVDLEVRFMPSGWKFGDVAEPEGILETTIK